MPQTNPTNRFGGLARIAGVSLLSLLAAACAADSQRFAGFSGADNMSTGSLPPADVPAGGAAPSYGGGSWGASSWSGSPAAAPRHGDVQASQLPPPSGAQGAYAAPQPGFSSVRPDQVSGSATGWTAAGGAAVSVARGDTVQTIADRYGVPPAAIRAANNLSGQQLTPGSSIVIPVYNPGAAAQARQASSSASTSAPSRSQGDRTAQVIAASRAVTQQPVGQGAPSRTLQQQAAGVNARPAPSQPAQQAQARPASPPASHAASRPATPPQVAAAPKPHAPARPVEEQRPAPAQQQAAVAPPAAKQETPAAAFRWPARGRIIQGFNARNGNEGINIALPEGTPVKAAESGVVAYAGNELKGYGNLVLIRHDNGWVSAYANNGELKVKRGERVSRGQTVATSGQSGNVSTPQLHFELRKGSTPVDPLPHLAGG